MSKPLYQLPLGLYEKALPPFVNSPSDWETILLEAKKLDFNFVEMSIDESSERLARLRWTRKDIKTVLDIKHKTNMRIPSICLSCHRAMPFGSASAKMRTKALDAMKRAVDLSDALGVRVIQLAGYDIYYEKEHSHSCNYFLEGMQKSLDYAAGAQVMLGMEIMDTKFMSSISRFLSFKQRLLSPWFQVYPDVGNVSAWNEWPTHELLAGMPYTVGLHLKDTYAVTAKSKGQFRDVPFGKGCVDFTKIFKTLKKARYQGSFLIEMWARKDLKTARKDIKKSKNWLITKMKGV